jgi:hypothetical protein
VRCWVKSRNERNPCLQLLPGHAENSGETAQENGEEGGDDVKSAWPLCLGPHTCYNGRYKALQTRKGEESLVIADQHAAVNTFPGLVHTARHTTKVCCT